jgi:hypothetical protein
MSVGADNMSKIYGILLKPHHHNKETVDATTSSSSSYPVLVNSYAGPHDAYCPKAFSLLNFIQVFQGVSLTLSSRKFTLPLKKLVPVKKRKKNKQLFTPYVHLYNKHVLIYIFRVLHVKVS